ncbi:MAG: multidrug efflux RND transporter permease subunit [Maricaulis sp.]|uniref:efflux RND transporter permease subunit n=1 Tax=Maricaulis sp. TaxID=1486257 RepID=UPI003299EB3D
MRLSHFFIDRPIFALVISVIVTLLGIFAYPQLPLSQYPEIAPPTVAITAAYPGATAEDVAEQVAAPLEQEINGVEGMLYMTSSSTADGMVQISVTFQPGTDIDTAQVKVQNRVNRAEPRLPEIVRQTGVSVEAQSTGFLLILSLRSTDGTLDTDYIGNYANTRVRDRLLRLDGVGDVQVFGAGNYSMRVWIDPDRAAAHGLTASDVVAALREQNIQATGGILGQPPYGAGDAPSFQVPVQVRGRLIEAEEFGNVVVRRNEDGAVTRLEDVARVELGTETYLVRGYFDQRPGVAMAIIQQPGANALNTASAVLREIEAAEAEFPEGMDYIIPYNPTEFVEASVHAVQRTLIEAVFLVVLVIIVFLQTWRAALIPIIAIPVSIVGVFAVQLALGFSINSLSLFAMVLAVGIVVDDAIVVVENVERLIREGNSPRIAARKSMTEVGGALIAMSLVLISVFIPTAFMGGIPGIFYRQFAVAIATAAIISLVVSLTLSPALCALLLKPHKSDAHDARPGPLAPLRFAARQFNNGFAWLSDSYGAVVSRLVRMIVIVLIAYAGLLALTGWRLSETPTGFIPDQDQGFLIGIVQLPPGASLERTDEVMARVQSAVAETEGVDGMAAIVGLDGATFSLNSSGSTMFIRLDPIEERQGHPGMSAQELSMQLTGMLAQIVPEGRAFIIAPPPVQGLGNGGGFKVIVQDRTGQGLNTLGQVAWQIIGAANQDPRLTQVFTDFSTDSPRVRVDVDRDRAQRLGVDPASVYSALGTYLGSTYVNDFNYQGRTYRVTAQAEAEARDDIADIGRLRVSGRDGELVPIASVASITTESGPVRVVRHNNFTAVEIQGQAMPGVASGTALDAMEDILEANLPPGFGYEWTEIAYQEKAAGDSGLMIFAFAVVFVFLVLAAQYEAFTLPWAVIFIVPMCILAAMVGINLTGLDNNILTQVGLIVLTALAAKNAILLAEFARQAEDEAGSDRFKAAAQAARIRLRPILMTSFAFILGVTPLAFAHGPGAEMRQALGIAVFAGMIGVTFFGLIFTPVFYVVGRWISRFLPRRDHAAMDAESTDQA